MALTKYKLGKLIELSEKTNTDGSFGIEDVRGINNLKKMMKSKADLNGRDLSKFQIVEPGEFVFNHRTSRNGNKFSITYNYDSEPHIFTEDYVVFHIKKDSSNVILKEWLYLYFCRPEFDRFVITNSWGSSTEFYNWSDICDITLTLPSVEEQRKYVDVYLSLQNNLAVYQSKVDELKLVCDGYIEDLKKRFPSKKIGECIVESNEKNCDNKIKEVRSVSVTKEFKLTNAKVNKNELSNYLIVKPKEIAFVQTTGNEKVLAFAYNDHKYPVVVSSVDKVFKSKDENILDLQFLSLFLSRKEFDRYARFNSWGSAREVFTMDDMNDVAIPIPDIFIQKEIVKIHKCYIERQRIAAQLKEQINNLCPILIKGSLQTNN